MASGFYYGYVILALCFFNMVVMRGVTGSFSVFYVALLEEFPWSHGIGASIASLNFLVYALVSPLVGWAFDRLGPRLLIPLSAGLVGAGLYLSGLSNSLGDLYLAYGVVAAIGQAGLGFVSHSALISYWFVRRRGTAIGIATMGQGLGAFLLIPLSQIFISALGWRAAFVDLAAVIILTIVPANAIFLRGRPADIGQLPDGGSVAAAARTEPERTKGVGPREWSLRSALGSFPFWSITLGHLALGAGLFMIYTHLVAHLARQGLDKLVAAFIVGFIGSMRIGGTLFWGFVSDRLGRGMAYRIALLITLVGIASLIAIGPGSPLWFVYGAAIVYGIGHSAGNPTYGALIGDIFAGATVGTIFGFLEISFGLGSAFGAWFGGYVYDLTGSYRWAFSLGLVTFSLSYFAVRASLLWQAREAATGKGAGQ